MSLFRFKIIWSRSGCTLMEAPAILAPCAGSTLPGWDFRVISLQPFSYHIFQCNVFPFFLHNFCSGGRVPRPGPQPAQEALGWSGSPPWKWIHLPNFLISIKMFISAFLISLKCHDEVICCDVMSYPRLQIKAFDLPPFLCEASRPNS